MKEKAKKSIAFIIATVVIIGQVAGLGVLASEVYGAENYYLKVERTGDSTIKQGSEGIVKFEITNKDTRDVEYDSAELNFTKGTGIKVSGGNTGKAILEKGKTVNIAFTVTVDKYAWESRDYTLVLKKGGEVVYESRYFYMSIEQKLVSGKDGNYVAGVDILYSITPSDSFHTGSGNSINFEVYNAGNTMVKDAYFTLALPEGLAIDNGSSKQNIGYLGMGERKNFSFPIYVETGLETKNYLITAKVDGLIGKDSKTLSVEKPIYVPVNGDGKKKVASDVKTPQLMVSGYSYGGSSVLAGTEFPLSVQLYNTSKIEIRNIKVTLGSDGVFVPYGGSSSFFVESIAARQEYGKTISLKCKADAEQKISPITVTIKYEDGSGNEFSAEESISVPVSQDTRLMVESPTVPMEIYVGSQTSSEVQFYNLGRTTLRNLRVEAVGNYEKADTGSYYAGNMDSGKSDSFTFSFIPNEVGPVEGQVMFTYEDAEGMMQSYSVPFSFIAEEIPISDEPVDEPIDDEKKFPTKWVVIGGILVAVIAGGTALVKYRKRKLSESLELEDDIEE